MYDRVVSNTDITPKLCNMLNNRKIQPITILFRIEFAKKFIELYLGINSTVDFYTGDNNEKIDITWGIDS